MLRISAVFFFVITIGLPAAAQTFDLSWFTIDAGGGTSINGSFELSGTVGQPDASPILTFDGFELEGGFWSAVSIGSPPCPADIDADGEVNLSDLTTLLSHFGTAAGATHADGDFDADGDVDLADLTILLGSFGTVCT